MGRDLAKTMFLVLTSILLLQLLISSSSGAEVKPNENGGICISKGGGRFSPYQSDACFSSNASNQVIVPCGGSKDDIISRKASKGESNGTVQTANDSVEEPMIESESIEKTQNFEWIRDIQERVREMTLVQKMTWVVAAIVVGGIYFNRWRYYQERVAMVQREARRLGSHMNGNA